MAKRGSIITVPESWLDQCRQWREDEGLSLEATGVRLGRAMRRSRPFAISTVRRYLLGELITDELTRAFSKVLKIPYPVQVHENQAQQQWCELGARLDKVDSEAFQAELGRMERYVDAIEKLHELQGEHT